MHEDHILQSWHTNAKAWSTAIRSESIASRKLVTNNAIVNAVLQQQPASVLDIGCGEGWLCRTLASHNIKTMGFDAIPALIDAAREQGKEAYKVVSYQDIVSGKLKHDTRYDVIVFNFSLFGNELVEDLLKSLHQFLNDKGKLIIQTLHPHTVSAGQPYKNGWRTGSWAGFSNDFSDPAPWYFRTIEGWVELLKNTGYVLHELREPVHPQTDQPASIIFIASNS